LRFQKTAFLVGKQEHKNKGKTTPKCSRKRERMREGVEIRNKKKRNTKDTKAMKVELSDRL